VLGDVEKMKKITSKQFDEIFDRGDDVSEFIDDQKLSKNDLFKLIEKSKTKDKLVLEVTKELKSRLEKKAKLIGLQTQDLIKFLLAKEVGMI